MNLKFFSVYVLVIIFVFFVGFLLINKNNISKNNFDIKNTNYIKIGGEIKKVDLALTPTEQESGPSLKNSLKDNEGMPFIKNNFDIKNTNYIKIGGEIIKVDLALTPTEQENGLSLRDSLKDDEGMLFIFDKSDKYPFWMKDMSFPIDIIWIGEDFHIVYIKKNALPESYPEIFYPQKNSKYVLEVNSQFSEKKNLKEGDKVEFLP